MYPQPGSCAQRIEVIGAMWSKSLCFAAPWLANLWNFHEPVFVARVMVTWNWMSAGWGSRDSLVKHSTDRLWVTWSPMVHDTFSFIHRHHHLRYVLVSICAAPRSYLMATFLFKYYMFWFVMLLWQWDGWSRSSQYTCKSTRLWFLSPRPPPLPVRIVLASNVKKTKSSGPWDTKLSVGGIE